MENYDVVEMRKITIDFFSKKKFPKKFEVVFLEIKKYGDGDQHNGLDENSFIQIHNCFKGRGVLVNINCGNECRRVIQY